MDVFVFDRLIEETDFCNFHREREALLHDVEQGACVRIFAPRNWGKTSLVKNIIAKQWESRNPDGRVVIYADFFSSTTPDEVSAELTRAFNQGMSAKRSLFERGAVILRSFKNVRPTWQPPIDGSGYGDFSIRTIKDEPRVDFETVLSNIGALARKDNLRFLLIMDEFQELAPIPRVLAKLRGALQTFPNHVSVVVLGSKQHILRKVFENPRAPFHQWGKTFELGPIPTDEYTEYANTRLRNTGHELLPDASELLQTSMGRIPEAMNRFCSYLSQRSPAGSITHESIPPMLDQFMEDSRSIYDSQFSRFSKNERLILKALAAAGDVESVLGKTFLATIPALSKSGVHKIVENLLDRSVIATTYCNDRSAYRVADPLMQRYLRRYHCL